MRDRIKALEVDVNRLMDDLKILTEEREERNHRFLVTEGLIIIKEAARRFVGPSAPGENSKSNRLGLAAMRDQFNNFPNKPCLSATQMPKWQAFVANHGLTDDMIDLIHTIKGDRVHLAHGLAEKPTTTMVDLERMFKQILPAPTDQPHADASGG